MQDYGAPVGWRLALDRPDAITAVITQNGNGYEAGLVEEFWKPMRARGHFLLGSHLDAIVALIRPFPERVS